MDEISNRKIRSSMSQLQLSARAYHRLLELARIIAGLAWREHIYLSRLAQARQY